MFDTLPIEIVDTIIDLLTDKRDLKNLCEVSKRLYEITVPKLYESIIVQTEDEMYLERLNVESYIRTCSNPINCLQFVKNIRVFAPFHRNLRNRCLHDRIDEEDDRCWLRCPFHGRMEMVSGPKKPSTSKKPVRKDLVSDQDNIDDNNDEWENTDDTDGDDKPDDDSIHTDYHDVYDDLEDGLMPFFEHLKENHLRTFCWDLGTCVPYKILGPRGYLPEKQNQIRSLTLKTAGMCNMNMEGGAPLHLSNFKNLRSFSWAAPRSAEDFEAIQGVLRANSDHLEELCLDLVDWIEADDSWFTDRAVWTGPRSLNFFAQDILELSSRDEEKKVLLPSLRDLTLSAVSFRSVPKKLACAFNFSGLRSLKLRNCPCTRSLLEVLINPNQVIKLTSLELLLGEDEWDDPHAEMDPVKPFLESFEGLEELSLLIADPMGVEDDYWSPIFHHQRTLKKLVYHERAIDIDEDSPTFELIRDMEIIGGNSGQYGNFDELKLECIGLSGNPRFMEALLRPLASKQTLKLLHVRRTGSDMRDVSVTDDYVDDWNGDDSYSTNLERIRDLSDLSQSQMFGGRTRIKRCPPGLAEFAQWAFGPNGYPELQVLAYGDFSHEGRYERHKLLLCRRESYSLSTSPDNGSDTTTINHAPAEQQAKETSEEGSRKSSEQQTKERLDQQLKTTSEEQTKDTSGERVEDNPKQQKRETTARPLNPFDRMMQAQREKERREKAGLTFRMMTTEDEMRLLDGINAVKGAREFLTACPIDPILES